MLFGGGGGDPAICAQREKIIQIRILSNWNKPHTNISKSEYVCSSISPGWKPSHDCNSSSPGEKKDFDFFCDTVFHISEPGFPSMFFSQENFKNCSHCFIWKSQQDHESPSLAESFTLTLSCTHSINSMETDI